MSLLPVFLKLNGRPALVVGAGEVATGKIESLVSAGANVTVVATYAKPEIDALAEQRRIVWHRRKFRDSDIKGQFVIVAGTNVAQVNQRVYKLARKANILTNAVDDPPHCDFYYGSVVSRGENLQIAISTNGESPAFAQRLRKEIDALLPADADKWLHDMGALRRDILAAHPSGDDRKHLLQRLAQFPVCESPTCPARLEAFPSKPSSNLLSAVSVIAAALAAGAAIAGTVMRANHDGRKTKHDQAIW